MSLDRTIYYAGPLFTQAEWLWNGQMAAALRAQGISVILPQETVAELTADGSPFDAAEVFRANVAAIGRCDAVVAVLDQADPDSGTCWECGYAYGIGKPVVGVRTDFRRAGDDPGAPFNLMLSQGAAAAVTVPPEHLGEMQWLVTRVVEVVRAVLRP